MRPVLLSMAGAYLMPKQNQQGSSVPSIKDHHQIRVADSEAALLPQSGFRGDPSRSLRQRALQHEILKTAYSVLETRLVQSDRKMDPCTAGRPGRW